MANVVFVEGPLWKESVASALKDTPNILTKIIEFKNSKEANPIGSFGNNDKTFTVGSPLYAYLPKARKAHLSSDMSIIYELSGKNPTVIKLYGVVTHADLGTGSRNIKKQKSVGKRLAGSF